jgi:hypothetical protein
MTSYPAVRCAGGRCLGGTQATYGRAPSAPTEASEAA